MTEIIDINKNKPHYAVAALCLSCVTRWIGTVISGTSIFKLQCPHCGECDSFATFYPENYLMEHAENGH
jgi:hypothetical protein